MAASLASKELFADAMRSPSTRPATVATIAMATLITSRESGLKCPGGSLRPTHHPRNAPASVIVNVNIPIARALTGASVFIRRALQATGWSAWGKDLRLEPGLDGLEQLEAHRAVVVRKRDHEAHLLVPGRVGVARQRANAGNCARLVYRAFAFAEQVGVGREQVEHLGETARGETVVAADARA